MPGFATCTKLSVTSLIPHLNLGSSTTTGIPIPCSLYIVVMARTPQFQFFFLSWHYITLELPTALYSLLTYTPHLQITVVT